MNQQGLQSVRTRNRWPNGIMVGTRLDGDSTASIGTWRKVNQGSSLSILLENKAITSGELHADPGARQYLTREPSVAVIILNWNRSNDTIEALDSLRRAQYSGLSIILLDNGSNDDSVPVIRAWAEKQRESHRSKSDESVLLDMVAFFDIGVVEDGWTNLNVKANLANLDPEGMMLFLIRSRTNLGFAQGCNVAIQFAIASIHPDFVLLFNNDAVIEQNLIRELVAAASADPRIGVAGPVTRDYYQKDRVISDKGRISLWKGRGEWVYPILVASADSRPTMTNPTKRSKVAKSRPVPDRIVDVDYVTGPCFFARTSIFHRVGLLDPEYFAYWEEVDFCFRVRAAGFRVVMVPKASVWHKVGASTSSFPFLRLYLLVRNRLLFMRKNASFRHRASFVYVFVFDFFALLWYLTIKYHSVSGVKMALRAHVAAIWWNVQSREHRMDSSRWWPRMSPSQTKANWAVESPILAEIEKIAQALRETLPVTFSMYLTGSFGRGEGSTTTRNERLQPLKDYDFVIICSHHSRAVETRAKRKVAELIPARGSRDPAFRHAGFLVDLSFVRRRTLRYFCDLSTIELREKSVHLSGPDVRDAITWKESDVPYTCGFRYLMEKHVGLLYLSLSVDHPRDPYQRVAAAYECVKTYVEMGTCLAHALGGYAPTYAGRLAWLRSTLAAEKLRAAGISDELASKIIDSHVRKLNSSFDGLPSLNLLWRMAARDLSEFLPVYLTIVGRKQAARSTLNPRNFEDFLSKDYFASILEPIVKRNLSNSASRFIAKGLAIPFAAGLNRDYRA